VWQCFEVKNEGDILPWDLSAFPPHFREIVGLIVDGIGVEVTLNEHLDERKSRVGRNRRGVMR